jgi:hypothetical protein
MSTRVSSRTGTAGGLLLWFAVLGGAVAWSIHAFAAWGMDELACAGGHQSLSGFPLSAAVGVAVAVPGLVAAAALVVSCLALRRTTTVPDGVDERSVGRAHLLAVIGVFLNILSLSIIVLGGVATLVLPPCQR